MQVVTSAQEYIQTTDSFPRGEVSLNTNQIQIPDEKLFICSIGFGGGKEEGKDSCISEGEVHQMTRRFY